VTPPRSESRLEALARSGRFCVTAEVVPPRSADGSLVTEQARALVGIADAVNVTDNPRAAAHMSPVAGAALVAAAGLEPTIQLACRHRNRLALTADLLGAWALGARNVLCLTGDRVAAGDHPDAAEVDDLTVEELVALATGMRETGTLPNGAEVIAPPRYFVGVADSPLADPYDPARLESKLDAGARFVQTQIVYDLEALQGWADAIAERGIPERASVIVGVAPLRGAKQARFLDERVPGVRVPPAIVEALEEAGDEAPAVGVERCVELILALRALDGVAGVHVMGMGHEEGVRLVVEGAGLLPRPGEVPS
jgi:methylenetetrahydrofolate reductase (NADPH)